MKTIQRVLWAVAALLALAPPALAQSFGEGGTISTAGADCSVSTNCVAFRVDGVPSWGFYLDVGTSGTFNFEVSGTSGTSSTDASSGTWTSWTDIVAGTSSATADGRKYFSNPGVRRFRIRASAINGAATVETPSRGFGTSSSAGGGGSFNGLLLDAAGGDPITDTTNDALRVNVVAGAAGGVTHTDDAAFTPATDDIVPSGAVFDDVTPDSVNEGDAGAVRMSANRNLYSTIRDAAGNERGANVTAQNELMIAGNGTAGTADANVLTIQGIASMTPIQVADNGSSLTVDGTVTVTDGAGALNVIVDSGTVTTTSDDQQAEDDNIAYAATLPTVISLLYCDNGSNFERCPTGAGNIGAANADTSRVVDAQGSGTYIPDSDESEDEVDDNSGEFVGFWADSLNTSTCYAQFFDADADDVTVGTTAPTWVFAIPEAAASGSTAGLIRFPAALAYTNALSVAATTTRTGNTGCSANVSLTVFTR